jgi:hypothetical protein
VSDAERLRHILRNDDPATLAKALETIRDAVAAAYADAARIAREHCTTADHRRHMDLAARFGTDAGAGTAIGEYRAAQRIAQKIEARAAEVIETEHNIIRIVGLPDRIDLERSDNQSRNNDG